MWTQTYLPRGCALNHCSLQPSISEGWRYQSGVHGHLGQPSVSFKKVAGRVNALSIQESTHFSPRRCASLPLRRFSDPINLRTSILESGYREPQSSKTSCKWRRVWPTGQNRDRAVCGGIWMGGCQVRRWGGGEEVCRPSQERVGRFLPKIPPTWCNYRHFMSSIIERIPSFKRKWGHCFIFSVSVKWSNAFWYITRLVLLYISESKEIQSHQND